MVGYWEVCLVSPNTVPQWEYPRLVTPVLLTCPAQGLLPVVESGMCLLGSVAHSWRVADTVFFKKSCLHVYLMLIFSTCPSRAYLVFGCVEMMWLRRNEAWVCGLSQRDGRSEGVMYKSVIKRKESLLAPVCPQCEGP